MNRQEIADAVLRILLDAPIGDDGHEQITDYIVSLLEEAEAQTDLQYREAADHWYEAGKEDVEKG